MPKDTKTLGNNKARACESLGFVHKKRLCQRFDTTSYIIYQTVLVYLNRVRGKRRSKISPTQFVFVSPKSISRFAFPSSVFHFFLIFF